VRRPGLLAGVLAVAALAYISLNGLRTEGPGSRGVPVGEPLPAFAVPLAVSDLEGDANVSEEACAVRGPDVLNVCQLAEQGPVVLGFFAEPADRCNDQVDRLDRLRPRFPRVRFAAVAVRGDRDALRRTVRERGWRLPVGHGAVAVVADLYAVAICPVVTFAERGGRVAATALGSLDERALARRVRALR
jgi:hypothetical protein